MVLGKKIIEVTFLRRPPPSTALEPFPRAARRNSEIMHQTCQTALADCLVNELLTLVFIAALPDLSNDSSPLFIRQSPHNVSQVCRKWRHVALSSPQLWARVNFDLRNYDEFAKAANAASAIPALIERSGHYPLDVRVIALCKNYAWEGHKTLHGSPTAQDWKNLAGGILRPLLAEQHRWRFARIVAPPELWQEGYDDDDQWGISNIPKVRDLHFGMLVAHLDGKPVNQRVDDTFVLDLSKARMLETFIFATNYRTKVMVDKSATFPRLHTVHVKDASCKEGRELMPDVMFRLLAASPQLEVLMWPMRARNAFNTDNERLPHLRLENLHRLSMQFVYDWMVGAPGDAIDKLIYVIDHLTLPQLTEFSLDLCDECTGDFDPVFLSIRNLFVRSAPPLAKLRLQADNMGITSLIECLSQVPSLEELNLDIDDLDTTRILEVLTVDSTGSRGTLRCPPLCPNLRKMKLSYINSPHALSQMLLSRSPPEGEHYPRCATASEKRQPPVANFTKFSKESTPGGRFGTALLSEFALQEFAREQVLVDPVMIKLNSLGLQVYIWESDFKVDSHDVDMDSHEIYMDSN